MTKIEIIPYIERWPEEFQEIAGAIRQSADGLAVRIDHIGSTSVPGLPAKNVIDVQVTVASLDSPEVIVKALSALGYLYLEHITQDHVPSGANASPEEWQKLFFRSSAGQRRANVHIRVAGKSNQRYAILFRDYLRANRLAADGYAEIKRQLARYHPDDEDAYYDIKDPVCDIIMAGAECWATVNDWQLGSFDA